MMPTGTLIRNTQRQPILSVIQPPIVGPIAGANTTARPYIANAWPRRSGGKASARKACEVGCSPPPAMPCRPRATISSDKVGASPQNSERDAEHR